MNNISTPQTQPQLHTLSPSQPVSVDGQYEPLQRVSISIEAPEAKIVEVEYLKVEIYRVRSELKDFLDSVLLHLKDHTDPVEFYKKSMNKVNNLNSHLELLIQQYKELSDVIEYTKIRQGLLDPNQTSLKMDSNGVVSSGQSASQPILL